MKKPVLLFIFFALNTVLSKGQTIVYHPFPTDTAQWSEKNATSSGTYRGQYGTFGDTLIDSVTYHKLYYRSACLDTVMSPSNSQLIAGMMEDTRQIYLRFFSPYIWPCSDTGRVYKLYDFSKQTVGDTLWLDTALFSCYTFRYFVIDSIDSALVYGNYRNRYHLEPHGETWIEGIGSEDGLMDPLIPIPVCGCNTDILTCYKQHDTLYYRNPFFLNPPASICYCTYAAGMEESGDPPTLSVFPNPFSKETTISTTESFFNAEILLYNSLGQVVKRQKNISGTTAAIKKDNLPSGIYLLTILQADRQPVSIRTVIADN